MSDPRFTLARDGLAAGSLQGLMRADRFAETTRRVCVAPSADLRAGPGPAAEMDDQLLFGEAFDLLAEANGYALGQARRDGYVGYVPAAALGPPDPEPPTHRIAALRAYAYREPDFKSAAAGPLPFNAPARVDRESGRYRHVAGAGWVAAGQLTPIGTFESDPAAIAERFVGAPYLWGARDGLGMDCSGLIQQALTACGLACPRDTDLQAGLGSPIEAAALRRGDLVCWSGHAGMMLDAGRLIHANTHHMAVAVEPLERAVGRIRERTGGGPTSYRRV